MVLEKIENRRIASHNCELYLLTDPGADGNFMFSYKRSTSQRWRAYMLGHAYKRKQIATTMNSSVSKRKRGEDGDLLALQNGEPREGSPENDAFIRVHFSAGSRLALESSLATREDPVTVACSSAEDKRERNALTSLEAEIKLCNSKMSENDRKSTNSVEAMGRTPFGEESHAIESFRSCEFRRSTRKEKGGIKEKADSNRAVFSNQDVNREFDFTRKPTENILPLNNDEYWQRSRTESAHFEKEHGPFEVYFLVIFARKVTVLQTIQRGAGAYCCSTVNGFSIGRLKLAEGSGNAEDRSATSSISRTNRMIRGCFWPKFIMDGDWKFEAMNHKETKLQLEVDTRFKSDYTLIKSGNFYLIESFKNVTNIGSIIKADLKLRWDSMLHLAELEQEKLTIYGCRTIFLPKDCVNSIENALKLYYESCGASTSVRSTLKIGSTYKDR